MTTLNGFRSLPAIPQERITDKITRRVPAGRQPFWSKSDPELRPGGLPADSK